MRHPLKPMHAMLALTLFAVLAWSGFAASLL
jgi:hypothetical protein